ncbi:DUF4348 domain-containing protein [Marinigracilibium pacificum]|uniref:DUF4348 domain-containing protein n=1 Tax=Marinigracilibium pacificum TaxID=2729599 RepID=A0A848J4X4_9BACT|nr:DUF4348 domain-containing protein [Marinigracilibium pacificum]NMM50766.1 DUF4348 domain-containing protein [Marinigracilibium pacificum]
MNRLIIILLIITIGCNHSEINSTEGDLEVSDTTKLTLAEHSTIIEEVIETEELVPEEFDSFFDKYSTDSIFQITRTLFPLEEKIWEIGEDEPTSETINRSQWNFITFNYHDSLSTRKIDPYTQSVNYGMDTTKIEIRGVDNGIFTDFNFVNRDGQWFLISIHDYSN